MSSDAEESPERIIGMAVAIVAGVGLLIFSLVGPKSTEADAAVAKEAAASERLERVDPPKVELLDAGRIVSTTVVGTEKSCCDTRVETDKGVFMLDGYVSVLNESRLSLKRGDSYNDDACIDSDCYRLFGMKYDTVKRRLNVIESNSSTTKR